MKFDMKYIGAGLATIGLLGLAALGYVEFNTPACNQCNIDLAVCETQLKVSQERVKRRDERIEALEEAIEASKTALESCR